MFLKESIIHEYFVNNWFKFELHGVRQDAPPKMESITYEIIVDTDESDHRLESLHTNIKKYGTVFNTVAPGTLLSGTMARA